MSVTTEEKIETSDDEIRLDSLFKWVWRGKWLILFLVLLSVGVAVAMGLRQPELYSSIALIEIGRVWGKPLKDIYVTVETANSPGFAQDVAAKTGLSRSQLNRVQVGALETGVPHSIYPILIRVTARTQNAEESVRLAQAVADEIIARHEKIFDESIAPHLDRQRQLEQQLTSLGSTPADRDFAFNLQTELQEVKASNSSPTSTEKTHLIEKIVTGATIRPDVWRGAASAGLIAAVVGVIAACLLGYYRSVRQL